MDESNKRNIKIIIAIIATSVIARIMIYFQIDKILYSGQNCFHIYLLEDIVPMLIVSEKLQYDRYDVYDILHGSNVVKRLELHSIYLYSS